MKTIIIGCNHAGTNAIKMILKVNPKAEVTAYDMNSNISFLGCGIALWVAGEFTNTDGLFYATPKMLTDMGAKIKMRHKVCEIDSERKVVKVKNLDTNEMFEDSYDKLIFSGGTWPIIFPIPGLNDYLEGNSSKPEGKGIFLSKWFQHAEAIIENIKKPEVKNIVVCGAGYIGIELVEAFHIHGKNVTLIDMEDRIISKYFDEEFTKPLMEKMAKEGIKLAMSKKVVEFKGDGKKITQVVTDNGSFDADMVIFSIGFKPLTDMLKGKVDMIANSAIKVDEFQRTSNPDIYAIGDCCALWHNSIQDYCHVALATNAVKTGIVAGLHSQGISVPFPGVQGTNGISVFGHNYASTGFSEESCKKMGIEHKVAFCRDMDRPEFMHTAEPVSFKVVFDPKTRRLLGAQIGSSGSHNHSEVIFAFSLAISKGLTLDEMALMDVYFLPHYNKPFNFMLTALLRGVNLDITGNKDLPL